MPLPADPHPSLAEYAHPERLVTADWLAGNLGRPGLAIVESDEDVLLYDTGHIPGAVKIDWHVDLNNPNVRDYIDGVQLVAAAWGWDVHAGAYIVNPMPGQAWANWPIRLAKMVQSTHHFGQRDLSRSLRHYGQSLIAQGKSMVYNGKDLRSVFER